MKFCDFVIAESVVAQLKGTDKEAVITELVSQVHATGHVEEGQVEDIIGAVLKREELGSTGIGKGVADPHTKHPSVKGLVGTVGLAQEGVDFTSVDGEPVHIFFLLISPPDSTADHLQALGHISKNLKDDQFCRFLRRATTREQIQELLDEADNQKFGVQD